MSRLDEALAGGDDESAERARKLAAAIAESRENTQDFVRKMRTLGHGSIMLYARLSTPPPEVVPSRGLFGRRQAQAYPDKRLVHSYSDVGRGWAVDVSGSEAGQSYAFVIDNPEEPTVYKNADTPSTSDNIIVRPDDVSKLEMPCLIMQDQPHYPAREHYVVEDMFSGDYGLRLLVDAIGRRGLPGY